MVPPNIPNHFSIRQHTITLFRMFLHWVPGSGAWLDQTLGGQSACGLLWRVRGLTVFFALGVEFFRAWIPPIRGPAMSGPCSHRRLRYCPPGRGKPRQRPNNWKPFSRSATGWQAQLPGLSQKAPQVYVKGSQLPIFGNHRWVILTWRCFNSFWNRDNESWSWSVWTKLLPHPMGIPSTSTWDPDAVASAHQTRWWG